ncbi:hypothetical protein FB446DRAFT_636890 [Lentinula raphanica]|nr:hypothetical protein FB446DRAFT_636890 [Lentinula raphanica]
MPFTSLSAYAHGSQGDLSTSSSSSEGLTSDVDPQILEALRGKDRIYVLRLGELMEELISEKRPRAELTAASSYQRLLLHRCCNYYKLTVSYDPITKGYSALLVTESQIPPRRLAELVPPEPTTHPAFKIMQRSPNDRRVKTYSHAGSVAGEDADLSDIEPSEAGSIGGRSSATGGSNKKRMTLEEREAAYNEARSRIFMDFDEPSKDKEMSASSSSVSVASSSAGGSCFGDAEDSIDSLATESERSGPSFNKRNNPSIRAPGSRPLRSSAQPFTSNGSGSSRNSRAPSPAFIYPSLYEPPATDSFDPNSAHAQYPSTPYGYPYSAPAQPSPYPLQPYPYYNPYAPLPPSHSPSEPMAEVYPPPPPMMYNPYLWAGGNMSSLHSAPPLQPQNAGPGALPGHPPPPPLPQQYPPPPFMQHPHGYGYPMPGYYTPPGDQSMTAPSHSTGQLFDERSMSVPISSTANGTNHNGTHGHNNKNFNRNGNRHGASNANPKPQPAPLSRTALSYGPGVGMGGTMVNMNSGTIGNNGGETTGPRLQSMRRQSNTSNGSSSGAYRSSNSDEASSIASSSTSSSSRRTYTSTASSQHPLPARPDWAVGLKPDSTLHSTHPNRHHDNGSPRHGPSHPRTPNGTGHPNNIPRRSSQQPQPNASLHSQDFPPLNSVSTPERRPTAGGVWTNPSRSVMTSPALGLAGPGNALVQHLNPAPTAPPNDSEVDTRAQAEDGFRRPPPRAAELYNPKISKRSNPMQVQGEKSRDSSLNDQLKGLSLEDGQSYTTHTRTGSGSSS